MLTDEEKRQIESHIADYPRRRGACIEGLKVIQEQRGWVSDEAIEDLAGFLDMSPHELDSVATFYNLIFRRPVGRHVILLCDSISCWVMGYERLVDYLREKLGIGFGETSEDNRFTLLPMCCLGTCDHAPALMIDEDLYRDLTVEQLEDILKEYS